MHRSVYLDYGDMTPAEARDALTRLLQTPEAELDLAEAALLIAAEEYADLRPAVYLNQITRMATELKQRIRAEVEPRRVVEVANGYLFGELHFKGNRQEYYDPRNSFLNEGLDRRGGLPPTPGGPSTGGGGGGARPAGPWSWHAGPFSGQVRAGNERGDLRRRLQRPRAYPRGMRK